jgi:hypothetical protein
MPPGHDNRDKPVVIEQADERIKVLITPDHRGSGDRTTSSAAGCGESFKTTNQ